MEEHGFAEGELDELLFMKCRRRQSVNREKLKLQIAVADLHAREQAYNRRHVKGYKASPDDVPTITPTTLYLVEREKAWRKTDGMDIVDVRRQLFAKASKAYRKAMVESGDFYPDNAEDAYSVEG